ncbi:hypothetical protein HN911_09340, partial [Candidatus Bathyarchaeota archaeon]|nr:hypothetical protein [Candidatus Bathyarchaeota archaeon]
IPGNTHGGVSKGGTGAKYVIWSQPVLDKVALLKRNQKALKAVQDAQPDEWVRKDTGVRFDRDGEVFSNPLTGVMNPFMQRLKDIAIKHDGPEWFEKAAIKWWNKDTAIERVQKELPPQEETRDYALVKNLMGKRFADELKLFDRDRLKPLLKDMAESKLKIADIEKFLHAEHAPERNLQMKRVNARRYIDNALKFMPGEEANAYKERIVEITDEFLENSLENNDMSINDRRDSYVEMMDEIADIDTDALEQELDNEQNTLNNRQYTEKEVAKGTPERLQKRLDKKRDKLASLKDIGETWTDIKDRLSGMTQDESDTAIRELGSEDMRRVSSALRSINSDTLDILHDSGEIPDGEYNAMNMAYSKHVPLRREGKTDNKAPTGLAGYGPLGKPLKIAYGSTKGVENIFANIIDQHQSAINRKHKLEAGKTLFNMVKENPDESMWRVDEIEKKARLDNEGNIRMYEDIKVPDNGFLVKVDGERHLITVPHDNKSMIRWIEAVKYKPAKMGAITQLSRKLVRILANLNTSLSPEFMMTNFMRDLPVAMIHLKTIDGVENAQRAVAKNVKAAIKGIYRAEQGNDSSKWSKIYRDFAKHGGAIGWMQGYEDIKQLAGTLEKELAYKDGKYPNRDKLRKLGKWITGMNVAIENGVRVSAYKAMIDGGMSKSKAARAAAGLTIDFTKHGTVGPTMNSFWMFANAGIQGNVRMITALATNRAVQKITAGIFAFGMMSSIMGALMGGDDDDGEAHYDKLKRTNPALFERNMVFMIPGSGGKYFRIPMPYGYNAFFVFGNEVASMVRGAQKPTDGMANIVSAILGTLNPLQSATLAQMVSPTLADPIIQMSENKTWSGGPLMPDKKPFGLPKPDSERYFSTVNPLAKAATKWLNDITGGSSIKSGWLDVSPETVEMVIGTMTGSAGRLIKDGLSMPMAALSDDGLSLNKIPGARKLVSSQSPYVDDAIHRTNSAEVDTLIAQLKIGDREERIELRRDPLMKMISYHKSISSRLRKLNKRRRLAEKHGRKEQVKKLKEQMQKLKRAYNKRYNRLTK